ncbi:MAG: hypothetical protein ACLT90_12810 [Enterococcus raffinosus]
MNDLLIEGVSAKWLIENHRLAPYEYYAPKLIDTAELKKASTGDFTKKSMDKAVKNTIYGDVLKHYKTLAEGEQAIAYCHSIEARVNATPPIDARIRAGYKARISTDAKTPKDERRKSLNRFANTK